MTQAARLMTQHKISTLIVDDEPLARERLRELLKSRPEFDIIGEAASGRQAVEAIKRYHPDLVFLDVQMPDVNGFGVLEQLAPEQLPCVIFVTAYDKYALKAFDAKALDYLLKPFDRQRFELALDRAKEQLGRQKNGAVTEKLLEFLSSVRNEPKHVDRLIIKTGGRVMFLRTSDIDWIEASGNYLRLHVGKDSHLFRETMQNIEAKLDPARFMRIHRSTIVNIERIKELQPWFGGEYVVVMRDGKQLTLSRGYRDRLEELLKRCG